MRNVTVFGWMLVALALTACSRAPVDSELGGGLRMALAAPGPTGVTYRLRNALFDISGPAQLSLDSDSAPDATVLSTELPAGDYQVLLSSGWYMERIAAGQVVTVNAVLQSVNPQPVSLIGNGTTDVSFVFAVNDLPVVFAPGRLDVAIEVVECDGSPGQWDGCRGNGCAVCAEQLVGYPLYLQNHPRCVLNESCAGEFFTCNDRCPAPSEADREPTLECNGTPGEWDGCRGTGCWVCAEQVQGYSRYFQNHPSCVLNETCDGEFFTCNAACPAPTTNDL